MLRHLLLATAALTLVASPALAVPCRGAKGKFVKCQDKAPPKAVKCKAANGRFSKCGTPGAKPI